VIKYKLYLSFNPFLLLEKESMREMDDKNRFDAYA